MQNVSLKAFPQEGSNEDEWAAGEGDFVEKLREDARVQTMQHQLFELTAAFQDKYPLNALAWSLELCTATLRKDTVVRLHAHVFLRSCGRIHIGHASEVMFFGGEPFRSERVMGASRPVKGASNAGLHYFQSPKTCPSATTS